MKEIARLVEVSLSSVSCWVRDVPLTDAQRAALRWRNPAVNGQRNGAAANSKRARARRERYQDEGRTLAQLAGPMHLAGCMLYWAEGARSRNTVCFRNSDVEMARFFVNFLRSYYEVEDEAFRVTCNLFADHLDRQHEIEQFWLDAFGLPRSCLRKSTVNVYSKHS
jgi:hypothetical protein